MTRGTPRLSLTCGVWLCVVLVSLIGCSPGDAPLATTGSDAGPAAVVGPSGGGNDAPAALRTVSYAVSPKGLAKRAWGRWDQDETETVVERIRAWRGGVLSVRKGATVATFIVPPGSLKRSETLSMSVTGQGLDTVIEFGPSGTTFSPPAKLILTFPSNGVNPHDIVSSLSNGGESVNVDQTVAVRGRAIMILASIPHFSIYDPDLIDGEVIPPEGP